MDSKRDNSALTQNAPRLPIMLGNHYAQTIPLLAKEQTYFTQYGGFAHKAVYGERQVLLSGTQSPLRHLHAPDECLRGLGFKVSYLGSMDSPIPSAIYKAVSPDGNVWRVAVSFIASSGMTTTNVSAAVWQWLQKPNTTWYALQRISPWSSSDIQADRQWDKSLLNALDLLPVAAASNNLNNTSLNSITNPTQS